MRLLADFHTHTKFSRFFHGKNTIEEMVNAANAIGLKEIAITDHGYNHVFGTNKANIAKARKIVDEINEWSNTKVLLGYEADIISEDGTLDIDSDTMSKLDILLAGYHRMIKTDFASYFGKQEATEQAIEKATNAYINAIEKYPITIVTHLNSILKTDLYKIGVACRKHDTMVEINSRHLNFSEEDVMNLVASGCMFAVNSDAHSREYVGRVENCFDLIRKYNIPSEYIVNVEFSHDEMTENHREIETYYGLYQQKQEEKQRKQEELLAKKEEEFSQTLSDEMEEALGKIAKEQGLAYSKPDNSVSEYDRMFEEENYDEAELIRRAKEFLGQDTMEEFNDENVNLEFSNESEENKSSENRSEEETPVQNDENEEPILTEDKASETIEESKDNKEDTVDDFNFGLHYTKSTATTTKAKNNAASSIEKTEKKTTNKNNKKGKLFV